MSSPGSVVSPAQSGERVKLVHRKLLNILLTFDCRHTSAQKLQQLLELQAPDKYAKCGPALVRLVW
jgi:hypothetical protein